MLLKGSLLPASCCQSASLMGHLSTNPQFGHSAHQLQAAEGEFAAQLHLKVAVGHHQGLHRQLCFPQVRLGRQQRDAGGAAEGGLAAVSAPGGPAGTAIVCQPYDQCKMSLQHIPPETVLRAQVQIVRGTVSEKCLKSSSHQTESCRHSCSFPKGSVSVRCPAHSNSHQTGSCRSVCHAVPACLNKPALKASHRAAAPSPMLLQYLCT